MVHWPTSTQGNEQVSLKNKGYQGRSNPPLSQASWRVMDIQVMQSHLSWLEMVLFNSVSSLNQQLLLK